MNCLVQCYDHGECKVKLTFEILCELGRGTTKYNLANRQNMDIVVTGNIEGTFGRDNHCIVGANDM